MCDKLGIDVWEVIRAAATKPFGFAMPFFPGPGLGEALHPHRPALSVVEDAHAQITRPASSASSPTT